MGNGGSDHFYEVLLELELLESDDGSDGLHDHHAHSLPQKMNVHAFQRQDLVQLVEGLVVA